MRACYHCGTGKSPCWRRGPAEKPLLCNACGAHFLVKKSLDGYMPGQRATSVTSSVTSRQQQQHRPHKKQCRQKPHPAGLQYQQLPCQHEPLDSDLSTHLTSSCVSASTSVDCWEGAEEAAAVVVSSRKRSRLVACSVVEADPFTGSALRCKRTFEAADGCVVTVVRRMRKQLKPRASCST